MAAFVRLKRKRDEEPTEKLIIASKRGKVDDSDARKVQQGVFRLAGTVNSRDQNELKKALESYTKQSQSTSTADGCHISPVKLNRKRKAYSLIGRQAMQLPGDNGLSSSQSVANDVFILDAITSGDQMELDSTKMAHAGEDAIACNDEVMTHVVNSASSSVETASKAEDDYVYDIFCLDSNSAAVAGSVGAGAAMFDQHELLESALCIEAFGEDYSAFGDYRLDDMCPEDDDQGDSSDSNAEDNWRNDYPEEISDRSSDEEGFDYSAYDDLSNELRFDKVRLASSEDYSDEDSAEEDSQFDSLFPENKDFSNYYKRYHRMMSRIREQDAQQQGVAQADSTQADPASDEYEDYDEYEDCDDNI